MMRLDKSPHHDLPSREGAVPFSLRRRVRDEVKREIRNAILSFRKKNEKTNNRKP
jgi:hypothetical protein